MRIRYAVLMGLAGLAVFWLILTIATETGSPQLLGPRKMISSLKRLLQGPDKTISTSKFQFLFWTAIIVFSYLVMFSYHATSADFAALPLSSNVLIVLGISATTAVAAKGIAVSNAATAAQQTGVPIVVGSGQIAVANPSTQAGIFQCDDGTPDLGKVQLVLWTLVGAGIYLSLIHHNLYAAHRAMPDIDNNLMVLMGLGNGAYLGKKIAGNGGS